MTKLLLISDNHFRYHDMDQVLKNETYNLLIHLGDSQMQPVEMSNRFDYYVGGNNDHGYKQQEQIIVVEDLKILLCHGHTITFDYLNLPVKLAQFCRQHKLDAAFFGHTHVQFYEKLLGVILINPGSISLPRDQSSKSYCIVTIDSQKIVDVKFKKVR